MSDLGALAEALRGIFPEDCLRAISPSWAKGDLFERLARSLMREGIGLLHVPNRTTQDAMRDAETGTDLLQADSVDDCIRYCRRIERLGE